MASDAESDREQRVALSGLLGRIESKQAVVGVVGLGYVGLPLALLFAEAGFAVVGFDIDATKCERLNRGESYIAHLDAARIAAAFLHGRAAATGEFARLGECDAILICVPTPLGAHREPDLSFVHATVEQIAARLQPGQLVALESTTYPGTTRGELLPRLERGGLACGRDFFLAFSPEREDPGNERFTTRTIPKLVGAIDAPSLEAAAALYRGAFASVVPVSSAEVAESAKILENVYRAVNIALVNELKSVFAKMGIDVWEVIDAAKTKPFGFTAFYPGPGLGGHCIPVDPFYLSWKAAEHGAWARFVELAGEINTAMPRYVVGRVVEAMNDVGRSVRGARILVLGLSYKPGIGDDRESPSYELIRELAELGAEVAYCDPYIPEARPTRKHDLRLRSVACDAETFGGFDALVVSTAHPQFLEPSLYGGVKLVVDSRNAIASLAVGPATRVVKA